MVALRHFRKEVFSATYRVEGYLPSFPQLTIRARLRKPMPGNSHIRTYEKAKVRQDTRTTIRLSSGCFARRLTMAENENPLCRAWRNLKP